MAGLFEGGKLSGQIRAAGCGGFTLARAAAPSIPPAQAAAAVADSGPVSLRDATTLEQSCGVVLRWVRRLKQEYPDLDLMRTPLNQIFPRAANLYRDKYFVPVFGTPFLNTTPEWRRDLQVSVVRKCSSASDIGAALREFRSFIERPFNLPRGDFSFAEVSERLGKIALLETWADRVHAALPGIPETAEGFRQLQEYRDKGEKDLAALWPSERAEFLDRLRARQTELARALVAQAVAEAEKAPRSLDGARGIADRRRQSETYLALLPPEERKAAEQAFASRLDASLAAAIAEDVRNAQALPSTLDGAVAFGAMLRDFDARYASFGSPAAVRASRDTLAAARAAVLTAAQAAFAEKAVAEGTSVAGLKSLAGLQASIFPLPGDRSLPVHAAYASALQKAREAWLDSQIVSSKGDASTQGPADPFAQFDKLGGGAAGGFDRTGYKEADLVAAIFAGNFAPIQAMNVNYVRFYLRKMAEPTGQACPFVVSGDFTEAVIREELGNALETRDGVAELGLRRFMETMQAMANPNQMMNELIRSEAIAQNAGYDANVLLQRYGCNAAEVRTFFDNATRYIKDPMHGVPDGDLPLGDLCQRKLSARMTSASKYCACAARQLQTALGDREKAFLRQDFAGNLNVLREIRPELREVLGQCRV